MSRDKNTLIESLGVYLPPKEVSSSDIITACKKTLMYPLDKLTGIKNRRMAGESEFAIDLAQHAIERCLERSKYEAEDIELMVCCNISRYDGPNFQFSFEPSTSIRLRSLFNMPNVICFDISNACAGMFTGVNIADAFLKAGVVRNALVVSGEYITHLTKTAQQEILDERDERMACLTLGDSGAAVILEQTENKDVGFHDIDMYTLGLYSDCCIAKPTDSKAGGAIMLTDSLRIHAVAISESVKHVIDILKKNKWSREKLQHFIMHQTARGAISELARQFNDFYRDQVLDRKNMVYNVQQRGNTSTTTHFVAIWDNIHNGRIQNGESVLFAVQASGITLGTAPYTFDDLPERLREFNERGTRSANVVEVKPETKAKTAKPKRRVRIESLGIIPEEEAALIPRSAIALATNAAERALALSKYKKSDIDLLIHSGVHREEFLCEPAVAALIAGKLELNPNAQANDEDKTFAFDVINGAVSFLNACQNGAAMVSSGKVRNAMILASEIENNADHPGRQLLGLKEIGSAAILDETPEGEEDGFVSFYFRYFTDYVDKFYSNIGQESGKSYLAVRRDPQMNDYYLACIPEAVQEYMDKEDFSPDQIKAVFPPQISDDFVERLSGGLPFDKEKILALANGSDYYTSSTVYCMETALREKKVEKGDLGLIINVGTGIQVGCALYQF